MLALNTVHVDQEIFTLKIIRVKNYRVVKFSGFHSIRNFFLTIDDCNTDKLLKSFWHLLYYQVSGEPGIAGCSFDLRFTPGNVWTCTQTYSMIIAGQFYFSRVKFSWLVSTAKLF